MEFRRAMGKTPGSGDVQEGALGVKGRLHDILDRRI
jgi:hypothetical protein